MSVRTIVEHLNKLPNDESVGKQYISTVQLIHSVVLQAMMGANFDGIKTGVVIDPNYLDLRERAYTKIQKAARQASSTELAVGGAGTGLTNIEGTDTSEDEASTLVATALPSQHKANTPELLSSRLSFNASDALNYMKALLAELKAFEQLVCAEALSINGKERPTIDPSRLSSADNEYQDLTQHALCIYENIIDLIQTKTRRQEHEIKKLQATHSISSTHSYENLQVNSQSLARHPRVLTEIIHQLQVEMPEQVEISRLGILRDSGYTSTMLAALSRYATATGSVISVRAINSEYRDTVLAHDLGLFSLMGDGYAISASELEVTGKPMEIKAKTVKDGNIAQSASPSITSEINSNQFVSLEKMVEKDYFNLVIENFRGNVPIQDPTYGDGNTFILSSLDGKYIWRLVPHLTEASSEKTCYRLLNITGLENNKQENGLDGQPARVLCEMVDGKPKLIVADTDLMSIDSRLDLKLNQPLFNNNVPAALLKLRSDHYPEHDFKRIVDIADAALDTFKGFSSVADAIQATALNAFMMAKLPKGKKPVTTIRHAPEVYNPENLSSIENILVVGPGGETILCRNKEAFMAVKKAILDTGEYWVTVNARWAQSTLAPLRASEHKENIVYGGLSPGYEIISRSELSHIPPAEKTPDSARADGSAVYSYATGLAASYRTVNAAATPRHSSPPSARKLGGLKPFSSSRESTAPASIKRAPNRHGLAYLAQIDTSQTKKGFSRYFCRFWTKKSNRVAPLMSNSTQLLLSNTTTP